MSQEKTTMGAGASAAYTVKTPFESVEAALAAGKTQEEIDQWKSNNTNTTTTTQVPNSSGITKTPTEKTVSKPPTTNNSTYDFRTSHKGRLTRSNVFCRIRPFASFGGHAETDEVQAKQLDSWDASSVSVATQYMFSKGSNTYSFPRAVFPPEATQKEVFDSVAPSVVSALTQEKGNNVVMFAYGQTGTGKTHTMFGPDDSLESGTFDERWGLFPRLVHAIFDETNKSTNKFIITASAVEFYLTMAYDLLNTNAPILIDRDHKPSGNTVVQFNDVSDLMPFLTKVRTCRTSSSTQMNSKTKDHDGSSRSHAALIVNILQLNATKDKYYETTLTLMDLAGAERPDKKLRQPTAKEKKADNFVTMLTTTGGGSSSNYPDMHDQKISERTQANVINFELTMLSAEIRKAGESHKKGRKYSPPLQNCPDMIKFLGSCFKGNDLMSMMVALSPSGNNGWETWFSCQYGTDLSKLSAPITKTKAKDLKKTTTLAEKTKKDLEEKLKKSSGGKYAKIQKCQLKSVEDELLYLKLLSEH